MNNESWIHQLIERLGFRHPEWSRKSECSDESWEGLRSTLGGNPPLSFQAFICEFGGARFGTEDHKIGSPILEPCPWGDSVDLEIAYPLVRAHEDSLEAHLNTYRKRLPPGTLPFSHDPGGNLLVLDVGGKFPGSVWFWDHEQRWFTHNIEAAARELDAAGMDARRMDVHQIIRAWARLHEVEFDRPADYMGMYRIAPDFETFLRSLYKEPY